MWRTGGDATVCGGVRHGPRLELGLEAGPIPGPPRAMTSLPLGIHAICDLDCEQGCDSRSTWRAGGDR